MVRAVLLLRHRALETLQIGAITGIGRSTPASIELARHVGEENPAMRILGAALRWLSERFSHSPTDPVRTIVGDVDLCLVADGADRQLDAASKFTDAIWHIAPCPPFTMIPISPTRLAEKTALSDHFFGTVLQEGVTLATED